jgi:hypothetical protein
MAYTGGDTEIIAREKAREIEAVFVPGVTDVWEEFSYPEEDAGGEIRCTTLRGILTYLCSASTYGVGVEKLEKFTRSCALQVVGPERARQGRL